MEKFAFIIHPLSIHDMAHVSPVLKFIPDSWLESALKLKKPFQVSHITGIKSPYAEAEGWFIGCPLTSKQMVELPEEFVMDRIIESGKIAQELGAKVVGLGAFTSIVGDAGITVAKNLDIAVTSGNSYTVATALEGTREAVRLMGKDLATAHVTIVGASGSIGAACTRILARKGYYNGRKASAAVGRTGARAFGQCCRQIDGFQRHQTQPEGCRCCDRSYQRRRFSDRT